VSGLVIGSIAWLLQGLSRTNEDTISPNGTICHHLAGSWNVAVIVHQGLEGRRPNISPAWRAEASSDDSSSLMAEVLEDHIRLHMMNPDKEKFPTKEIAEDLIDLVRAYLK
jgi:hypothetical protein